jgi:hypothetical protein
MAEKLVPYYQVTDDGVRLHIPKPTTVGHVLKVTSLSPLAFEFGAASGGGGSGDFVGPASSTDLSIMQFDGTTGKLGKVAPVKITGAGAMVPDADGTQQLGNKDYAWTELWAKQVTNKVQASAQAPSGGWTTSHGAFWTKTGGLPQHTYNGTDRQLALAGANSDITSLSGLTTALSVAQGGTNATTAAGARSSLGAAASGANSDITSLSALSTPLSIGQGGTGQTTAAGAFGALKQDASTSATGVVEVATYLEGQSAPGIRVENASAAHNLYRSGFAEWGLLTATPIGNTLSGSGSLGASFSSTGTFTAGFSTTPGSFRSWPTSTSTGRGFYSGESTSALTWANCGRLRYSFKFGGNGTFRIYGALAAWGTSTNVTAAESSTAAAIRFGIDNGTIRGICADGSARTAYTFTATASGSTIYEFEMVINLAASSVAFNLYDYTVAGGRGALVESGTVAANIPTGATAIVPLVWSLATSGTPTAYGKSIEVVANTV